MSTAPGYSCKTQRILSGVGCQIGFEAEFKVVDFFKALNSLATGYLKGQLFPYELAWLLKGLILGALAPEVWWVATKY